MFDQFKNLITEILNAEKKFDVLSKKILQILRDSNYLNDDVSFEDYFMQLCQLKPEQIDNIMEALGPLYDQLKDHVIFRLQKSKELEQIIGVDIFSLNPDIYYHNLDIIVQLTRFLITGKSPNQPIIDNEIMVDEEELKNIKWN